MKKLLLPLLFLLGPLVSHAQHNLQGLWNTGKENTVVHVVQEDGGFVGKVASSDNSRAVVGKVVLKDIKPNGDHYTGQLFVVQQNKWFDVSLRPSASTLQLVVSAGLNQKKVEWARVGGG